MPKNTTPHQTEREAILLNELELVKTPEGFLMASSKRFRRLYGRDGCISAWQLLDYDPDIAKNTILELARHQGKRVKTRNEEEPGKIPHEISYDFIDSVKIPHGTRLNWAFLRGYPYYGSIDATFLWLLLIARYYEKTKNKEFLDSIWDNVSRALDWALEYADIDGDNLIEYRQKNKIAGLKHQGWKDGVIDTRNLHIKPPVAQVEVQGYAYAALKAFADIYRTVKKDEFEAEILSSTAERLHKRFAETFWMEEEQYFAYALDADKNRVRMITSNPGHLLFTNILDKDQTKAVVNKLFRHDMWTPYGIRTHSTEDPYFSLGAYHRGTIWPHDNWIIHEGLLISGYPQEAERVHQALLKAFDKAGRAYEFWQADLEGNFYVPKKSTAPFAWSVGALLDLSSKK